MCEQLGLSTRGPMSALYNPGNLAGFAFLTQLHKALATRSVVDEFTKAD